MRFVCSFGMEILECIRDFSDFRRSEWLWFEQRVTTEQKAAIGLWMPFESIIQSVDVERQSFVHRYALEQCGLGLHSTDDEVRASTRYIARPSIIIFTVIQLNNRFKIDTTLCLIHAEQLSRHNKNSSAWKSFENECVHKKELERSEKTLN